MAGAFLFGVAYCALLLSAMMYGYRRGYVCAVRDVNKYGDA